MLDTNEIEGPPFIPHTDCLRKLQAAGIDIHKVVRLETDGTSTLLDAPVTLPPDTKHALQGVIPKGMTRWNWYRFPDINTWADRLVGEWHHDPKYLRRERHRALSSHYEVKYQHGDQSAPFDFVADDSCAFRATWLQELIEQWHDSGEEALLKQLMTAYATRGRARKRETVVEEIRRDLKVYRYLVNSASMWNDGALSDAGSVATPMLSVSGVKEIRDEYQRLWKEVERLGLFVTRTAMLDSLEEIAATLLPSQPLSK